MAQPKKSDSATRDQTDWTFLEREGQWWPKAIKAAARKAAAECSVDRGDLEAELTLWLAVRPQRTRGNPARLITWQRAMAIAEGMGRHRRYETTLPEGNDCE